MGLSLERQRIAWWLGGAALIVVTAAFATAFTETLVLRLDL